MSVKRPAVGLPETVLLCAISHRVSCHENMVVFSTEDNCGPCYTRLSFERKCGCWYVTVTSLGGDAMVAHIAAAQRYLDQWFGGDHCFANGEYDL